VFRGDMYGDGEITGRMVRAAEIDTIHLKARSIDTLRLAINGVAIENIIAGAATLEQSASHSATTIGMDSTVTLVSTVFEVKTSKVKVSYDTSIDLSMAQGGNGLQAGVQYYLLIDGVIRRAWLVTGGYDGNNGAGAFYVKFEGTLNLTFLAEGLAPGFHTISIQCLNGVNFSGFNGAASLGVSAGWKPAIGYLFVSELRR
jgi:hypothetical protein